MFQYPHFILGTFC